MVRTPLSKGDDGSANRYPARTIVWDDAEPVVGHGKVAADDKYDARVTIDGDELYLPFTLRVDSDYTLGEPLNAAAQRVAIGIRRMMTANEVKVTLYPAADNPNVPCQGDDDPEPVGEGTAY